MIWLQSNPIKLLERRGKFTNIPRKTGRYRPAVLTAAANLYQTSP